MTCNVIENWHVHICISTLVPKMHSKERVKFRVFSRNGLQPVVVIHRGGYFNSDKFYCLPDEVVTFDVGSQR